jgi:hypothetical protein
VKKSKYGNNWLTLRNLIEMAHQVVWIAKKVEVNY